MLAAARTGVGAKTEGLGLDLASSNPFFAPSLDFLSDPNKANPARISLKRVKTAQTRACLWFILFGYQMEHG